ncbi:MAG: CRISPR system precrRNA processing endoribonuclease RAMP protein Cas6, partial [Anaerolineae bacterium]|nr:CRISPR system precrRNA processing endoribonuclease RAMP protein Cas6 [Anaerolineae bacterium]
LPVPELVFGSLIDRWAAFSSAALHPDLKECVARCVAVSEVRIQTRRLSFERSERGAATGFTGDVTFVVNSPDRFWLGQLHALADFARYSGIGVRTTMGMGQARAVRSGERAKEHTEA